MRFEGNTDRLSSLFQLSIPDYIRQLSDEAAFGNLSKRYKKKNRDY